PATPCGAGRCRTSSSCTPVPSRSTDRSPCMPELPEVEFAARALRRWLGGRRIASADAPESRIFRGSDRKEFSRVLQGESLDWIERRGKYLLIAFRGGAGLLNHLGMTGKWVRVPPGAPLPSHVRARLELDSGEVVAYRDT